MTNVHAITSLPPQPAANSAAPSSPSAPSPQYSAGPDHTAADAAHRVHTGERTGHKLRKVLAATHAASEKLNDPKASATIHTSLNLIERMIDTAGTVVLSPPQKAICLKAVKVARGALKVLQAIKPVVDKIRSALQITEDTINSLGEAGLVSPDRLETWRKAVTDADRALAQVQGGGAGQAASQSKVDSFAKMEDVRA